MSPSVSPLGSLSDPSPSPSPSPPPNPIDESELSELTDDDHDNAPPVPPPRYQPRKSRPPQPRSDAPSSKRRKRGGLVPAPMWGWAYKGAPTDIPPDSTGNPLPPPPVPGPSRTLDTDAPPPPPQEKQKSPSATPDAEEEEEEEIPPRAMEEEEAEEPNPRKDRPVGRSQWPRKPFTYQEYVPRKKRIEVPMPFDADKMPKSKRRGIRPPLARISKVQNDAMLKRIWEQGYKIYNANAPTTDEEDQNPSSDDVSLSSSHSSLEDDEDEMDVDDNPDQDPSPPAHTLDTNTKPTPAPSTSALDPAADNTSVPPSMRASVDPTVTPPDEDVPVHAPDGDVDQDHYPDALDDDDRPEPDAEVEPDADEEEDAQPEEPSQPPSPTPLAEPEPEPEPEPEDEDPDLQPAHRAEALDVLATIELKFALLRERVYVEKMEGLAWEETLVWDGTHPEFHHLQSELTKRRDKRLMLASKKRTYEIEAVTRKRRETETWCWEAWDTARTELQTDMIAETNRKRRKLDRERRTVERPPGRRVPNPILNPPPAPTLRQIANTFPLPSHLSYLAASKKSVKGLDVYPGLDGLSATTYPDLQTLSPHDIAADLDFLFQHRRMGFGFGMGFGPSMGISMAVGVGASAYGPAATGFGGPTLNGLGIGGPVESYPSNPGPGIAPGNNATQMGAPPLALGGSGPGLALPPGPPQNAPNAITGPGGMPNNEGPSFSQPTMGVFQGPPSVGTGSTGYPLGPGGGGTSIVIGPGGATSTPPVGPGGARIQRPSGFVEREREHREREMIQREREMRERELTPREREREREFGANAGPGYPAWGHKPAGGMDWGIGDARRREEKDRIERNERDRERDRSQVQPIVPTPTHRHLHPHPHSHSHTHQLQQHPTQPHQPHPVHAHQSHSHQHSQHPQHLHPHGQHQHPHTQHQHGASHAPPHHHVGPHHHHRHHHHVVHHHHPSMSGSGASSSGPEGASPLPQSAGPAPGVQTMEIINLSANSSSKSHWKRDEVKLNGSSMPGSRPSSTHPLPPSHGYDEREREREWEREREREREREWERDRPIATPFVLAPSHHTISSTTSSPRHGWTPGPGEPSGPASSNVPSGPFPPPERFHTPVPHRFSNPTPNGISQLPRPLTTSPPRAPPSTTSPSISSMNAPLSSTGPFSHPRKSSPGLPKLSMPALGYSPRLAGPGVVPPTGPGVPGVLSTANGGPGVTPSGILTSGPGVPPGPGIAPAPVASGPPDRASPLIPYGGPPVAMTTPKVGVDSS